MNQRFADTRYTRQRDTDWFVLPLYQYKPLLWNTSLHKNILSILSIDHSIILRFTLSFPVLIVDNVTGHIIDYNSILANISLIRNITIWTKCQSYWLPFVNPFPQAVRFVNTRFLEPGMDGWFLNSKVQARYRTIGWNLNLTFVSFQPNIPGLLLDYISLSLSLSKLQIEICHH